MAASRVVLQTTSRTGLEATYEAANTDGNFFANTARKVIFQVKNGGGAPITVTIGGTETVDGRTLPAKTVTVTNAEDRFIGPFPKLYEDSNGDVNVSYSAVTSVTVAAFKIGSLGY